jgi:hypothetical protein
MWEVVPVLQFVFRVENHSMILMEFVVKAVPLMASPDKFQFATTISNSTIDSQTGSDNGTTAKVQ